MPTILTRASWGAAAARSRTSLDPARLDGVTVHWFGSPKAAATHTGCDDLLRSVQRTHMAPGGLGVPTGGADIAYNHAVCPHGTLYELRGFGVKTGANGTSEGNNRHAAIVYMAGTGDPLTEDGKVGLNYLIAEWRSKGAGVEVLPHKFWTGSACPGPDILAWLAAGRPTTTPVPNPEEPAVKPWMPLWFNWYLNARIVDGATQPRPATIDGVPIPPPPYPDELWEMVKAAEAFRAAKPDSSAEAMQLRLRIEAAKKALG